MFKNISYPYKYCKLTTKETCFKFCSCRIIKIHYHNKGYMTVHKSHLVIRLNYPKNQLINELSQQTVTECQLWARHWKSKWSPHPRSKTMFCSPDLERCGMNRTGHAI